MRVSEENDKLTIFLEGKIDTEKASETEREVADVLNERKNVKVTFDAENLEYISSSGLRVLLRISKMFDEQLDIVNASKAVYEILDVTGFTQLYNVRKAFRKVSVDGMKLIGRGMTGDVYRADEETVIKVFNKNISFDLLIRRENEKARNAFISGVPTAIPYDIVRVGDCYGTVYEFLKAKDLVSVIAEDKEHLDDYIRSFAQTVRKIHSIEVSPDRFEPIKNTSIQAVSYLAPFLTEEEIGKVRAIYESIPDRNTFIHGDCHIGNVMIQDGEMMLIDLATAGMGHPIIDLTSMYSLFVDRANDPKAISNSPVLCNFTQDEIKHIWDLFIRSYLGTDDEAFIRKTQRQISILSVTRRLFMVIAMPGVLSQEAFNLMKQAVINYYDSGIEEINF